MERVGVDILGFFIIIDFGNKFILVVGDYWIKWIEVYAISDYIVKIVVIVLVEDFFFRFGLS